MSRDYLFHVGFEQEYPESKLRNFFRKWCGEDQIYKVHPDLVIGEMGCSGGVAAEDTIQSLYEQLKEVGFDVIPDEVMCWSLHPDDAIYAEDNSI